MDSEPIMDIRPGARVVLKMAGLRYVGVVGNVNDYAVYCQSERWPENDVATNGDKTSRETAEMIMPMFKQAGLIWRP